MGFCGLHHSFKFTDDERKSLDVKFEEYFSPQANQIFHSISQKGDHTVDGFLRELRYAMKTTGMR